MRRAKMKQGILVFAVTLLLTACGMGNSKGNSVNDSSGSGGIVGDTGIIRKEAEAVWSVDYLTIPEEYSYMVIAEDGLYRGFEEEGQAFIERLNKENGQVESKFSIPEIPYIKYMNVNDDGTLSIIGQDKEGEILAQVSSEGSVEEITHFVLEDMEGVNYDDLECSVSDCLPKGIYRDNNGYTYIWYEIDILASVVGYEYEDPRVITSIDRVYVKDEQLKTIFYEQILSGVWDFQLDEAGVPFFVIRDGREDAEIYRQELDVENRRLKEKTPLEWPEGLLVYEHTYQTVTVFASSRPQGIRFGAMIMVRENVKEL